MSPPYQVVYLPEAEAALEKTVTYITEHDGRQRAANWLRCMIESIDKLETMPALFAVRGVRGGRKIRSKPVMSHLAYYVIDEPRRIVFIIDVAAGAQGPKRDKYEGNA